MMDTHERNFRKWLKSAGVAASDVSVSLHTGSNARVEASYTDTERVARFTGVAHDGESWDDVKWSEIAR